MRFAVLGSVKFFPNLAAALKGVFNRVVTILGLYNNNIGDEGAIAIAEALKINGQCGAENFTPSERALPHTNFLYL